MKNNFDIPLLRFWKIKYKGGSNYTNVYVQWTKIICMCVILAIEKKTW